MPDVTKALLRYGLITPIASLLPGTPDWEKDATPDDLRAIARAADALGFAYLTCSEHVGVPRADVPARGPRFYDPLATLGFLAAVTTRVRLLTHIVVLPYHHPLAVAKRYGTLDRLSSGRLVLGVGVGSLRAEFELLGVDFEGRGPRFEEGLAALRAALAGPEPSFRGEHFRFEGFVVDPCAVQARVPIWLGGRTPRSLRRAVTLGDGWVPFGLSLEELGGLVTKARATAEYHERAHPFDVALAVECPEDGAGLIDRVSRVRSAGATVASLTVRARSAEHYVEQLHFIHDKVMQRVE
jgi:probable F420-dependent oxidoreductase